MAVWKYSIGMVLAACVAGSGLASWPATVAAAPSDGALHEARRALVAYDLEGEGTVGVLRSLTALLEAAEESPAQREARFLRAAVGTDLVVIARAAPDMVRLEDVSSALGVADDQLVGHLESELRVMGGRVFGPLASQALTVLSLVQGSEPLALSKRLLAAQGTRRDFLVLEALLKDVRGAAEPLQVLAAAGGDPCEKSCELPFKLFDKPGRRAMAALQLAASAGDRLQRGARGGDPFSKALAGRVGELLDELKAVQLRPMPVTGASMPGSRAERSPAQAPDFVVLVSEQRVRYAHVPSVRVSDELGLELVASGAPALPEMGVVELPTEYRPFMRPIQPVVEALDEAFASGVAVRVGVGPDPAVPAHVLGRAMLSLQRVTKAAVVLLAATQSGEPTALPLEIVAGSSADSLSRAQLRLRVRLGGYTLKLARGDMDIPRVRTDEGLSFDAETLSGTVAKGRYNAADISFMSGVASEHLVVAMFQVAPRSKSVRLLIP